MVVFCIPLVEHILSHLNTKKASLKRLTLCQQKGGST